MPAAHAPEPDHIQRLLAFLNQHVEPPTWAQVAAGHGVELVDLSFERERLASNMTATLQNVRDTQQQLVDNRDGLEADGRLHTAEEYLQSLTDDLRVAHTRAGEITDRPDRYYLATGEIIQHGANATSHRAGWWFTDDQQAITAPAGERFHAPGIHPSASIHPTAHIDPTARIEPGVTIGPGTRVGPYAHVGREAQIGPRALIQEGAWIGPLSEVWNRSWICPGATVGARSVIGNQVTIGAGSQVDQLSEIEPYSRIGSATRVNGNPTTNPYRGIQIANAIERLMTYDRE